jgi:hypothetical protein
MRPAAVRKPLGVMRETTIIFFLFLSLTSVGQNFVVSGRVNNPFNDYSANVLLYAFPFDKDTIFSALSDSMGNFSFGTIPSGRYKIKLQNLQSTAEDSVFVSKSKTHLSFTFPKCVNANTSGICSK